MTRQELQVEITKAMETPRWVGIRSINRILSIVFEGQDAKAKITINTPNLGVKVYDIIINGEVVFKDLSLTDETDYYMDKAEILMIISEIMLDREAHRSEDLMWLKSNDADLLKIARRYGQKLTPQEIKAIKRYDHMCDNDEDYEDVPDHIQNMYHDIRLDLIDVLMGL